MMDEATAERDKKGNQRAVGETSRVEDVYKNFDVVFKDAMSIFKDKAVDFSPDYPF